MNSKRQRQQPRKYEQSDLDSLNLSSIHKPGQGTQESEIEPRGYLATDRERL